ncbi:hypothetical protein [Micromonospora sp. NPDC023888]|uniref:hypothetical protein n=1 Tax=Micromonospora sp. NPDC023888 TaxID=3155607 RepID=UPI0033C64F69
MTRSWPRPCEANLGYVLAVACSYRVPTDLGIQRADRIAAELPKRAWQRISAGDEVKGHRYYDWAFITLPQATDRHDGHHWLLIRRNRTTAELAFYRCWSPELVPLHHLVGVAGKRWTAVNGQQECVCQLTFVANMGT